MPRPSLAIGGISALALVACSTLPSLLGGGRAAKKERVAYAVDAHTRARTEAAVRGSWGGSAGAPPTEAAAVRHTARTAPSTARTAAASTASSKATSHAPQEPALAVTSSGGSGLASAAVVKAGGGSVKLVSDHTSNVPLVAAVQQVQQRLGVDPVDGSFGALTEQAVTQFQSTHGPHGNGVVDGATRKALGMGPGPTLRPEVAAVAPAAPVGSADRDSGAHGIPIRCGLRHRWCSHALGLARPA